jgi:hypothetical protein
MTPRSNFTMIHTPIPKRRLLLFALLVCFFAALTLPAAKAADAPQVNVILWFDTEDFLLPASDDACKRLAELLTDRDIRATFKIVGEKARVLERRGRQDVISALKKHDIGYHTNLHSVHPAPTEYLADCGLLDGIAEFIRREGGGAADVRRIFSIPTLSCYGQPGSSWAPQAVVALKELGVAPHGVPCYVDEDRHIGLDNKPFWYSGALHVFNFGPNRTRMGLHNPAAVEPAKRQITAIVARMQEKEGGGLISIGYHPCEWVHKEFWDAYNFRRGANPPREQWKAPPQRSTAETDTAFRRFAEYIDSIHALPSVRFVTAGDLPLLYPDAVRREGATKSDLNALVSHLLQDKTNGIGFHVIADHAYSVADQLELLTLAVGQWVDGKEASFPLTSKGLLGPDAPPPPGVKSHVEWYAFRDAVCDVRDFIQTQRRVPSRVFIGAKAIPPANFLIGMAAVYDFHEKNGRLPDRDGVMIPAVVELLPTRYVAEDTPDLFGRWPIHKEGFRAPRLLDLARLQTWTLKPAVRGK